MSSRLLEDFSIRDLAPDDDIPYALLLEADPSRKNVDQYLDRCHCRIAVSHNVCVGVYALLCELDGIAEIMNIAVSASHQGLGLGKALVRDAVEQSRKQSVSELVVGTGNSSLSQLAFYQKCGFRIVAVELDYFTSRYPDKIFENGIWCRDMLRLSMHL